MADVAGQGFAFYAQLNPKSVKLDWQTRQKFAENVVPTKHVRALGR